jgi:hypothetical protein
MLLETTNKDTLNRQNQIIHTVDQTTLKTNNIYQILDSQGNKITNTENNINKLNWEVQQLSNATTEKFTDLERRTIATVRNLQ